MGQADRSQGGSSVRQRAEEEERGDIEEEGEETGMEATAPNMLRDPPEPTQKEREEHDATHLPSRPWCRICIEARAKEQGHMRVNEDRKNEGVPTLSIDYAFIDHEEDAEKNSIVVMKDHRTRYVFSHVIDVKGGQSMVVNKLLEDIQSLGYKTVAIQCDAENAIKNLRSEMI